MPLRSGVAKRSAWGSERNQYELGWLVLQRRVTTGHNGDDGRSYFSGFLLRQQRIGTRGI